MKSIKKYLVLFGLLAFVPVVAHAEITVKDTTSPEFIHNQGYSDEVSRIIKIKTKDPATPIPKEKQSNLKKAGWWFLETIDPTTNRNKFGDHSTNYSNSIDDL